MMNLNLGYTESAGSPALREEISRWYPSLQPDQIVVTSGAEEAIFISMQILLNAGDEVIVQTPAYQSLTEIPAAIGCRVIPWMMNEEDGKWVLNPSDLNEMITPATRAVVINSPHNPTGHHFSPDEWREIREICADRKVKIISDEVYRGAEHSSSPELPAMADGNESGYSLGVMSKALGLAGLRIGWIASPDTGFIGNFLRFKDYTTICNSGPSEYLATLALQNKEEILRRNNRILRDNLGILSNFMDRHSERLSWAIPKAGSTAFPRLAGSVSGESFCTRLLNDTGILLLPGSVFGVDTPHFRIGYGRRDFAENLSRFDAYFHRMGGY